MIRVISTGGTIAERPGEGDRFHLSGQQLIASLPGKHQANEVDAIDLLDVPSSFIRVGEMLRIGEAIKDARDDPRVIGVVVTHGTATMEETAFLVDLTSPPGKPVVFTGALLMPDQLGYDGLKNFEDAISTASCPESHGKGVLVVMNGEIHAARDVVKAHATALNAFRSPEFGPVGRIDAGKPYYARIPHTQQTFAVRPPLAQVQLVTCYAGIESDVLDAVRSLGPRGIVVQGMSSGAVPPWLADPLGAMVEGGIAVVLTTRCAEGRVITSAPDRRLVSGYPEDLFARGIIPTDLPGLKARLKLSLLLSSGISDADLSRQIQH